jgi:hypothetical protein
MTIVATNSYIVSRDDVNLLNNEFENEIPIGRAWRRFSPEDEKCRSSNDMLGMLSCSILSHQIYVLRHSSPTKRLVMSKPSSAMVSSKCMVQR